jgi:hypothetical protein
MHVGTPEITAFHENFDHATQAFPYGSFKEQLVWDAIQGEILILQCLDMCLDVFIVLFSS